MPTRRGLTGAWEPLKSREGETGLPPGAGPEPPRAGGRAEVCMAITPLWVRPRHAEQKQSWQDLDTVCVWQGGEPTMTLQVSSQGTSARNYRGWEGAVVVTAEEIP